MIVLKMFLNTKILVTFFRTKSKWLKLQCNLEKLFTFELRDKSTAVVEA